MIDITLLAQSAEWLQKASDFCSTNWSRILGWISIPTIVTVCLTYILKFIFLAIQTKKIRKANTPLVDKLVEIKSALPEAFDTFFKSSSDIFSNGIKNLDAKVERMFNQYNAQLKSQYEKIMGMTIEDALKKVENILSEPEILVETVESEVCEKEPEVEDKTPQTENMDAKQEETPRTETIVFER